MFMFISMIVLIISLQKKNNMLHQVQTQKNRTEEVVKQVEDSVEEAKKSIADLESKLYLYDASF